MGGAASRWKRAILATTFSVLGAAGCVGYRAEVARDIQRGEVTVRVQEITGRPQRGGETRVDMVVREVPPGLRLRGASVSGFKQSFCEGVPASKLGREAGRGVAAPLVPGEHLSLAFDPIGMYLLALPSPRLDLSVETARGARRCVSLPLADAGKPLRFDARQRFTVGVDLSFEGFPAELGPVSQVLTFPLQVGMWIDRYHLEVGAGIATAGCPESHCQRPSEQQRINYATAVPIFAGVRMIAWEYHELSIGAALRYRAIRLAADTFEGHRTFWMQGPVLAPYIGSAMPFLHLGARDAGGAREDLIAIEIPVGYAFAENGERSVSVGANFTTLFTVL
jgi:hypothetical protein